jgi:DNA-damage-inducible protein D
VLLGMPHITNNKAVRGTLLSTGIRPESLTPAEDVKKVERRCWLKTHKRLKSQTHWIADA